MSTLTDHQAALRMPSIIVRERIGILPALEEPEMRVDDDSDEGRTPRILKHPA
jgi:hypothetical protein